MKMEYVLPKMDEERIAECKKQIEEIKQSYIDAYEKQPFLWYDLHEQIRNDTGIQILEKYIANIYAMSVGKYIVAAESEEDREKIEKLKNETDMNRQFYLDELKRWVSSYE